MNQIKNVRNKSLDLLKALMIIFVIFTHTSFSDTYRNNPFYPLIIDMAVPVFMIISGYVNSISISRRGTETYYNKKSFSRKLRNVGGPFLLCALFDIVVWIFVTNDSFRSIIIKIVFQQWGDGGYYPFILFQFILIFPILYKLCETKRGIAILCLVDIITELMFSCLAGINEISTLVEWIHRMLIFRYLGFIVAGILIFKYKAIITKRTILLMFIAGFGIVCFLNYEFYNPVIFQLWRTTSFPVVLWAASWVLIALNIPENSETDRMMNMVYKLGRSTYYVFLFQMLWFFLFSNDILKSEPNFLISIIICCSGGLFWNSIDSIIEKRFCRF